MHDEYLQSTTADHGTAGASALERPCRVTQATIPFDQSRARTIRTGNRCNLPELLLHWRDGPVVSIRRVGRSGPLGPKKFLEESLDEASSFAKWLGAPGASDLPWHPLVPVRWLLPRLDIVWASQSTKQHKSKYSECLWSWVGTSVHMPGRVGVNYSSPGVRCQQENWRDPPPPGNPSYASLGWRLKWLIYRNNYAALWVPWVTTKGRIREITLQLEMPLASPWKSHKIENGTIFAGRKTKSTRILKQII